ARLGVVVVALLRWLHDAVAARRHAARARARDAAGAAAAAAGGAAAAARAPALGGPPRRRCVRGRLRARRPHRARTRARARARPRRPGGRRGAALARSLLEYAEILRARREAAGDEQGRGDRRKGKGLISHAAILVDSG